jgi:FRG domain-containing protein
MMSKKRVLTIRLPNWRDARILADEMHDWTFRGQQDATWMLDTTLQRAAVSRRSSVLLTGAEEQMIEQFQRRAHQFLPDSPPRESLIDWMALIQHFGGSTRLLDFTRSFYVAAFFAVEKATTECAIWCIDTYALYLALKKYLDLDEHTFWPHWETLHRTADFVQRKLLIERSKPVAFERFVFEVQPFKLNERLVVQQGVFLCPMSVDVLFIESLAATFGLATTDFTNSEIQEFKIEGSVKTFLKDVVVVKILLPLAIQHDVLEDLWNMNVNAASLFPGLDGLGRSLNYYLRISHLWDIKYDSGGFADAVTKGLGKQK